jgi:hypothetical protein
MGTLAVEQGVPKAPNGVICEGFLLQHYVTATEEARRNAQHSGGIRSTLIACILFAYTEFIRGHFRTALRHINGGLKILRDVQARSELLNNSDECFLILQFQNEVDNWIRDAFLRLYVQVQLIDLSHGRKEFYLRPSPSKRPPTFGSINDAWQELERIFCDIFLLANHNKFPPRNSPLALDLTTRQEGIKAELLWWQITFGLSAFRQTEDA